MLSAAPADADALRRDWRRSAAATTLLLALLATAVAMSTGLGTAYVAGAVIGFALALPLVGRGLAAHPHPRFGAANRVTLLRLALVAGLLAALPQADTTDTAGLAWGLVGVATLAALLDAVDGPLARRSGLASAFGARFDMEVDALLILVLSLLLVGMGRAGPWVLAAGLLRYGFVAAARGWPWLAAPLPPSRRRQAVCVAQIVALIVALAPVLPAALAAAIAGLGLVALLASFAIDIAWLARSRPAAAPG
jgi:phosphatidylglycerophosphate synthase